MAYEIPQELEYKEIIMFGMTFEQLIYASIGSIAGFFFYFRTNLNIIIKWIILAILLCLSIWFMYFNAKNFISHYSNYLFFIKRKDGKEKMKNLMFCDKVEKDKIIESEKEIAVLKIEPINFSIKSDGEKEAIIEAFRKFLNSLDFPIQILINTHKIDLDNYLERVKESANKSKKKLYQELYTKYSEHLKDTISNQGIMDRGFYILVPQKENLLIEVAVCEQGLKNLDLKFKRLTSDELKNFVKDFYGNVKFNKIQNTPTFIKIDKVYNKIIYVGGYPRLVEPGFLDKIVSAFGNFDLSIHIVPYPIETMLVNLDRELQKQSADLFSTNKNGKLNPSLELKIKDTRQVLEELQKGNDKLFYVSLYINCKADSEDNLKLLVKKVESTLSSLMIVPRTPIFRMVQGLRSIAPLCHDTLNEKRNITSRALSAFIPFTSPFFKLDDTGVWFGVNKNNIPIIRDIFSLSNPNGIVLAQSGGGKSFFSKLLIARHLLNGTKVMVIDPQGEYRGLVEMFKGQRIDLSRNSNTMINPLDLMGHDYTEKRLSLMDLIQVMLGELTEPQKAFIDRAITESYNRYFINENPETWNNTPPRLEDVQKVLMQFEKDAILLEKSTIRSLINRLSLYVDGVFSFMNKHTNIDFSSNFVCFDIGDLPKQVKPVVMFLVLDYVYMKMRKDLTRKLLVIDESWSLLSRTEDAAYIFEIVKTCRKFNLGLLLINQEVEGLLSSNAGKSVLANSSYTVLMKQKPAVIDSVVETFHLSKTEKYLLLSASVGEGILIIDDDHSELKVIASKDEADIITTKADDLLKNRKQKKSTVKKKPETILKAETNEIETAHQIKNDEPSDITLEKRVVYRHKDLKLNDLKYLELKGYKQIRYTSAFTSQTELFMVRQNGQESSSHTLMVNDIKEYLDKNEIQNETFISVKPDIIFTINNKTFAVEVETGSLLEKQDKLREKIEVLKKDYNNWFFVVTDLNLASKYRPFGKTIDKRGLKNFLDNLLLSVSSDVSEPFDSMESVNNS